MESAEMLAEVMVWLIMVLVIGAIVVLTVMLFDWYRDDRAYRERMRKLDEKREKLIDSLNK